MEVDLREADSGRIFDRDNRDNEFSEDRRVIDERIHQILNLSRKVLRRRNDDAAEEASTFALVSGQHFVDRTPYQIGQCREVLDL
jgi:hypothetical protein